VPNISNTPAPIANLEHPCALVTINKVASDHFNRVTLQTTVIAIRLNAQGCSRLVIGDGVLLIRDQRTCSYYGVIVKVPLRPGL
jgi:hypothetical protein